jgi:hypothetical protein
VKICVFVEDNADLGAYITGELYLVTATENLLYCLECIAVYFSLSVIMRHENYTFESFNISIPSSTIKRRSTQSHLWLGQFSIAVLAISELKYSGCV